jgi:GTP-binding protein HflX
VGVDFGEPHFDAQLEELGLLASTAGLGTAGRIVCKRRAPDAALFVGSGKADEIRDLAENEGASEVLFDQALSPAQQRNLERHIGLPVNDRTYLILHIFAPRARSHEGKLQVELARLQYLSTRLVRRWSHLERQSGGIGMRGGPGEKQIELDRRMIDEAVKRTRERLHKVKRQRGTQRRQRERRETFNISLVGYTNAGKSTLFNALVKARAYAADQLFATLDTTTRQLYLGEQGGKASLSDTVGFIRDLPHGLVDAFEATLQEAADADLLLHVVDAANPAFTEQIDEVLRVLGEIGAGDIDQILVFNKLDAIEIGRAHV